MNIGIFDSGLGGLQTLSSIVKVLPDYNYIYLGDNARAPYGNRSQEIIYEFTKEAVNFLFSQKNCQIIILACNTASSEALRKIQQEWLPIHFPDRKVLGVLIPLVEHAVEATNGKVGVIGTKGTVDSEAFIREIHKINPQIEVFQKAAPLLVPVIEEGDITSFTFKKLLRKYLKPLKKEKIDSLILGCTHYFIINDEIQKIMGKEVTVVNSSVMGYSMQDYLQRHPEIEEKLSKDGKRRFYVTDDSGHYIQFGHKIFKDFNGFEKVTLST